MQCQYLEESTRPWGRYQKLFQDEVIWVKRLEVFPHSRLSLQKHQHRREKWIIIQGQGMAIINDEQIPVAAGHVVDIPLGAMHRMCNLENEVLVFIEVASGEYLGEDDIIRFKDDYDRVSTEKSLTY